MSNCSTVVHSYIHFMLTILTRLKNFSFIYIHGQHFPNEYIYPFKACLACDRVVRVQTHIKPSYYWASDNTNCERKNSQAGSNDSPITNANQPSTLWQNATKHDSFIKKLTLSNPKSKEPNEVCMGFQSN